MLVADEGDVSPEKGGIVIAGVNKSRLLVEKRVPVPFCSPRIPHGLVWDLIGLCGESPVTVGFSSSSSWRKVL